MPCGPERATWPLLTAAQATGRTRLCWGPAAPAARGPAAAPPEPCPRGALTRAGPAMASADAPSLSLGPGDARVPGRQSGHPLRTDPGSPLPIAPKPPLGPVARERGRRPAPQRPLPSGGAARLSRGASRGHSPLFSTVTKNTRVERRPRPAERPRQALGAQCPSLQWALESRRGGGD